MVEKTHLRGGAILARAFKEKGVDLLSAPMSVCTLMFIGMALI